MKKAYLIFLFLAVSVGCGLTNSDKKEKQELYEWDELSLFKKAWVTAIATFGENELYIAQDNLLSYSENSGKTFTWFTAPDSAEVKRIKIYDRLYVIGNVYREYGGFWGSTTSYLYASDDMGKSWEEITGGFIMQDFVIADGKIHIGRKHGVTTFDIEADSVLYLNGFLNSKLSDHMEEITASSDGSIYVSSHGGIFASYNGGQSWEKISSTIYKSEDHIRSIIVDDDNDMIYGAGYNHIYYRNKEDIIWDKEGVGISTEVVRLLRNNDIVITGSDKIKLANKVDMKFQDIGPVYNKKDENDVLSFEYLEIFSDDKIIAADFDHIYIGTPIKN